MIAGIIVGLVGGVVAACMFMRGDAPLGQKRFGLKEMEAAETFVKTDGERNAVKGVLLGVLGYKNIIDEDLDRLEEEIGRSNSAIFNHTAVNKTVIADCEEKIAKLKAEIKNLHQNIASLEKARDEKRSAFEEKEKKAAKWA